MFVAISAALLARSHFKKYNFLSHTFFCTWINKWCIKFTLSKTWLLLTHWDVFFFWGGLSQQVICNSLNTGMFFGRWSPVSCRPLVEAVRGGRGRRFGCYGEAFPQRAGWSWSCGGQQLIQFHRSPRTYRWQAAQQVRCRHFVFLLFYNESERPARFKRLCISWT